MSSLSRLPRVAHPWEKLINIELPAVGTVMIFSGASRRLVEEASVTPKLLLGCCGSFHHNARLRCQSCGMRK